MNDRSKDTTPDPDGGFEHLKAVDPAAKVVPDLDRIEALTRARIRSSEVPTSGRSRADDIASGRDRNVDELAGRRERRLPRWVGAVAAAAAAAVLIGGGGFAAGRSTGGAGSAKDFAAAPDIDTRGSAEPARAGGAHESGTGGGGGASADVAFGGRTVFTATGLSNDPGSAPAWGLDPSSAFSKEKATALAKALEVPGTPELRDGAWTVGSTDGTGRSLRLEPDGLATFSLYDPTRSPECVKIAKEGTEGGGSSGEVPPRPPECSAEPAELGKSPTKDEAVNQMRELIGSLGLDGDAFEYVVEEFEPEPVLNVTAHLLVDKQRAGVTWSMAWYGEGVQSVNGALAPVVELGSYDVVSEEVAVSRLNDPRFGASSFLMSPEDAQRGAESGGVTGSDVAQPQQRTVPPAPKAGTRVPWPVERITLTKATLGVGLHHQPNGAALLLPTYQFSADDGRMWTVLAVADRNLDFDQRR